MINSLETNFLKKNSLKTENSKSHNLRTKNLINLSFQFFHDKHDFFFI